MNSIRSKLGWEKVGKKMLGATLILGYIAWGGVHIARHQAVPLVAMSAIVLTLFQDRRERSLFSRLPTMLFIVLGCLFATYIFRGGTSSKITFSVGVIGFVLGFIELLHVINARALFVRKFTVN